MKLIADRELLLYKLSKAVKFIPGKTIVPAFDNFKLTVAAGVMEIIASDGNLQCKMYCNVSSKDSFAVCLPAKLLVKTIALFRENEVTITIKSDIKVELKSGKSKYNIGVDCKNEEYPVMTMAPAQNEMVMQQFFLSMTLKAADKFVDEKSANANFIGINIAEINNKMVFTGLDGMTMCRCAVKPISISKWESVVIPTQTASKVISMLQDKGEIGIAYSSKEDGKIIFFTDREADEVFEICSVTSNVKFPDTEMVFSKKPEHQMILNTLEFKDAVKRLGLYTSAIDTSVTLTTNPENIDELILTAGDKLTNRDGEELMTIINPSKQAINKSFNNEFLTQILAQIDQNDIVLLHSDIERRPCQIIPKVNSEEENIFSFIITQII